MLIYALSSTADGMSASPGGVPPDLAALTDQAFEALEAAVHADEEQQTAKALELFDVRLSPLDSSPRTPLY
jgi:hypothetical protein